MNDTKAKEVLNHLLTSKEPICAEAALKYALEAIDDRAALVEEYRPIGYNAVVEKVKDHMGRT